MFDLGKGDVYHTAMRGAAGRRSRLVAAAVVLVLAAARVDAEAARFRPNGFALGVVLGVDQLRDDALVPFRWTGPLVGLSLGGDFRTDRIRHQPELSLSVASAANHFGQGALAADVAAAYRVFAKPLRLAGGGFEYGGLLFYRQHNALLYSWDDAHDYWLNGIGVGPALAWRRALSPRAAVGIEAAGSLIAFVSRPPAYRRNKQDRTEQIGFYFIENFRDLHASLPDRYQSADVRAGLEWRAGRGVLAAGYRLDLVRATWPAPGIALLHGVWFRWCSGAR